MVERPSDRSEVLFLALTRPALVFGVPIEAFALNASVTLLAGMILSAPTLWRSPFMFWLAGIPVHFLLQRITSWDFHGFRTIRLWLETAGTGRTILYALSSIPPRTAKEIPSSV
jgi:type IV secretory pathway VirB3-like protein